MVGERTGRQDKRVADGQKGEGRAVDASIHYCEVLSYNTNCILVQVLKKTVMGSNIHIAS